MKSLKTAMLFAAGGALACSTLATAEPWQQAARRPVLIRKMLPPPNNPIDAFPFSDNFDSYATGLFPCSGGGCSGPNGWSVWYSGGASANISTAQAFSGTKSMEATSLSDITQTGNITSGQWVARAMTYFPSAATGTPRELYFILMDSYTPVTGSDHWSVQIRMDGDASGAGANTVLSDIRGTVHDPAGTSTPQALIYDQWVEIRANIDLTTDRYTVFYNNAAVYTGPWTTAAATPGTLRLAAMDLYSNGVAGAFWDDVSIQPATAACYPDCNGDHALNVNDFICFQSAFAAGSPSADCDHNTALNVNDFICFQSAFAAGCSQL